VRSITVNADARNDAQPLTGDNLRHAAAWNNARLADLPPGKYAIRLHLNQATVYALTLD
jgi:hypothetical protein